MTAASRGRARLGVLVPFTNVNLEPDMGLLMPPGVSVHVARLGGYDADAIPDEAQMAGLGTASLDEPLRLLAGARPHAVLYGCTSATLTHGPSFDRDLADRIERETGAVTVTAAGALVHALRYLDVRRIAFASPYVAAINRQAIAFLAEHGVETVSRAEIGKALGNHGQGELSPDEVFALGLRADSEAAQAIVLSCTEMRAVEVIERLESAINKPVITSNQAMAHQAAIAIGLARHCPPIGLLLRDGAPAEHR